LDYDSDTSSIISPSFEDLDERSTVDEDHDDNWHQEEEWIDIDEGAEDLEEDFCDAELFQHPTGAPRRPGQPRRLVLGTPAYPPPDPPIHPRPGQSVSDARCLQRVNDFAVEQSEVRGSVGERSNGDQSISTTVTRPTEGFIIVGDNIDKNVRPSFQRVDRTESWHCFHSYAVCNRIDVSKLKDGVPSGEVSSASVLPNMTDLQGILKDFQVLVSR